LIDIREEADVGKILFYICFNERMSKLTFFVKKKNTYFWWAQDAFRRYS